MNKEQLTKIIDDLIKFYNKPGMALHFQPSNLREFKQLITRLMELEIDVEERS